MTYAQLESLINKWSLELEDQERHFLQQATQVNAWDRTLIENGEPTDTRKLVHCADPGRTLHLEGSLVQSSVSADSFY